MENKQILIFGGTFNPLSRAHGDLIRYLKRIFKPEKVIILPTGNGFFHSRKHFDENSILPLDLRLKILNEYKKRNKNIEIELIEVEGITSKTYDSLNYLQSKYPDYELLFCCGTEKADELVRWYKIEELLEKYRIVLIRRNFDDFGNLFTGNEFLKKHKEDFILVDSKDDLQDISSTKIREAIKNKDINELKKLTYVYVIDILKSEGCL